MRPASGAGTLLDIGGGSGVIQHELLGEEVASGTLVDAASDSVAVARDEAQRRGHEGLVEYLHGDFVAIAERTRPADLVTLDRVICCYPDMQRLVAASAEKARQIYAFSVPRNRWYVRLVLALENRIWRLRGSEFRTFAHPIAAVEQLLGSLGLRRRSCHETVAWHVALYVREPA